MKKFAVKFLIFFMLVTCSVGILNFLYINTYYWKNEIVKDTIKFEHVPRNIQLANLGSSHGFDAFNYSDVSYQSFNFSLGGQYFVYDFAILKQYISYFNKNAVLFIPISYNQITQRKMDFADSRARYYRFLENELIDDYSIQEKMLFTYVPVLTAENTLRFIIKDLTPPSSRYMTEAEFLKNAENRHQRWISDDEAGEEGFVYNKHLVSQIIDVCYAHNIQPILVTTPITSALNTVYQEKSPEFFDTFYRFTRELREEYPSLLYLDYSHDPRFENDYSLFSNADHLNSIGAKKFTDIVIHDLQANGIVIPLK